MTRKLDKLLTGVLAGALLTSLAATGAAQTAPPLSGFVLSGYGSTNYGAALTDDIRNNFSASISPIILYSLSDNFLFEAEFEFELEEGGATETALEYAQIDFLGFGNVQLVAGKFLLPYGLFSERLHPSWINKMPSMPLLYGHAHGGVAEGSLLPVLSDVGAMGRLFQGLGETWSLDLSVYISQGPKLVVESDEGVVADDGHTHDLNPALSTSPVVSAALAADLTGLVIPDVAFGTNISDNNKNKMLGARLGIVQGAGFEAYVSGFHAMYDDEDFLDLYGGNFALELRRGQVELRGEAAILWQELQTETAYPTLRSPGYYIQASRRFGPFEPVVRWSQLLDGRVEGTTVREGDRQIAFGLDYWINPSVPVKAALEVNMEREERLLLQWAIGF